MPEVQCFSCSKVTSFQSASLGRREECLNCRSDLHVCKNCMHFDPKVYNECRESSADVVREKERANFCDYFQPALGRATTGPSQADLMAAAEALFKKK